MVPQNRQSSECRTMLASVMPRRDGGRRKPKGGKGGNDLVHVLSMAGINDGNGVSFYRIGKVPLVGVGHVTTIPS